MTFDLIALGILSVFVAIGAFRGLIATAAGLISLVVSYVAAAIAAGRLGPAAAQAFELPSILGPVVAGSIVFALTFLACGIVTFFLKRWDRSRRDDEPRGLGDRLGGASFGLLRGTLIVLLISVLASWVDAARDMGVLEGIGFAPETEDSRFSAAAGDLIESITMAAVAGDDSDSAAAAKMVAKIAARPGESLASAQSLMEDDRIRSLQQDKLFWVLVENGAGERAINQASFYSIVHDPEMRDKFADIGVVPPEAVEDPAVFKQAMSEMLSELGPRIKGLREDAELQALARDPEIVAMLENGDTLALMTHPDVQRIVSRLSSQP
jgi:membrane protein required for colicin V production